MKLIQILIWVARKDLDFGCLKRSGIRILVTHTNPNLGCCKDPDILSSLLLLELACVALMNMFHSYPSAQGRMVKSKLKNGVGDILDNCSRFTAVLLNSIGVKYNKDSHPLGKEQTVKPKKCLDYIFIPYSTQYCGLCKILIGIFWSGFFDEILKTFLLSVVQVNPIYIL